ncbi:MAG TPA: hypothetical protein VMT61_10030 [Candidatus Binataceae bacterium]|nr:hypothetical protein [Candidatus Binataceae bacterium]
MQYEIVRDSTASGNWCVQSRGPDGIKAIASFVGDEAHLAALEYAAWRAEIDEIATLRSVFFSLQIP